MYGFKSRKDFLLLLTSITILKKKNQCMVSKNENVPKNILKQFSISFKEDKEFYCKKTGNCN